MFLPKPNTDLFRELFLFTTDNGGEAGGASSGGSGEAAGGGTESPASEGQAAAPAKPAEAKPEATLSDKLKAAFAEDTKPATEKKDPEPSEEAKPGEGEAKPQTATEKAIAAGVEAKLATERETLKEQLRAELAEEGKTARQADDDAVIAKAFTDTVTNVRNDFRRIPLQSIGADGKPVLDDEGKPVMMQLTEAAIDRVLNPHLDKIKDVVRQVEEGQFLDGIADATLANLPNDEVREHFAEKAGGKDWQEYQAVYAEEMAPYTKWAKQMQANHAAELTSKAAEVETFLKEAPQGQASQRGSGGAAATTTDGKSVAENAAAIKEGRLDVRAELARITGRR